MVIHHNLKGLCLIGGVHIRFFLDQGDREVVNCEYRLKDLDVDLTLFPITPAYFGPHHPGFPEKDSQGKGPVEGVLVRLQGSSPLIPNVIIRLVRRRSDIPVKDWSVFSNLIHIESGFGILQDDISSRDLAAISPVWQHGVLSRNDGDLLESIRGQGLLHGLSLEIQPGELFKEIVEAPLAMNERAPEGSGQSQL